ncbi:MAG: electron transport complex subunit RsxC, partial [Gammaproteobacteria bacterium]
GELIARPIGLVSAAVHAPTSGTVVAIEPRPSAHPSGLPVPSIVLQSDGQDDWVDLNPAEDFRALSRQEIRERIRMAGIAGMGGAGFPTAVKLTPPKEDKVQALIINAVECEPYITADDMLMRERAREIVRGIEIMAHLLEPGECLIAIEDNKPEAIAAMNQAVAQTGIEVVVVPTKYPSGGEKQLIRMLTGKEVPAGRIPADIGVMCQNVGTAYAVHEAISLGKPLISRITTVTGEGVADRGNFEVRIGTPVRDLLEHCELDPQRTRRIIMGGPMMGFTLEHLDAPVTKTTNCLIAATEQEFPDPPAPQPCIRCGFCAEVCPAELLPQQLFFFSQANNMEMAERYNLMDCIECGACAYVCPSHIPLVQYYRYAKGEIRLAREERARAERARERYEQRLARIEREKAEKEARRKARAEAAAAAQAAKRAQSAKAPAEDKPAATPEANSVASGSQEILETLRKQVEQARKKLDKVKAAAAEVPPDDTEAQARMAKVIEKNTERMKLAEQKLADAEKQAASGSVRADNPPAASVPQPEAPQADDPDVIARKIKRLQNKISTLEQAIEKTDEPARRDSLMQTLNKEQQALRMLQAALGSATGENTSPEEKSDPAAPDLDALKAAVANAQRKLDMMQNMLEEAQANGDPEDKIAKLMRAVSKNEERLKQAQDALTRAQATLSEAP